MKRRDFLRNSAIAGTAIGVSPYLKASPDFSGTMSANSFLEDDSIMILVELFGGNDGLNTIIPLFQDEYYSLRPNIAIESADAIRFDNTDLYMHPALVTDLYNDGFLGLLRNGNLAIVERVGYENYSMSHFRSADIWSSGIISRDPSVKLLDGWLGRYFASKLDNFPLEIPEHPLGISLEGKVPLVMRSPKGHMGIALSDPESFYELGAGLSPSENKLPGDNFYQNEYNFIHVIAEQSEIYSNAVKNAFDSGENKVDYPDGLAKKFQRIARLISGGLKTKVYYVRLSNFDSHVQQMTDPFSGQHPILLRQLSEAISLFMQDATLQGFADRVAGLTTSEFGRRAYDNGSRGSDHGAGNVMFMFAHDNNINSGRKGDPPDLSDIDGAGNVRYQFDFRRLYADFLETWFGASKEDVENVFGEEVLPMGILKKRLTSVEQDIVADDGRPGVGVFPNPGYQGQRQYVRFTLKKEAYVKINIFTIHGKYVSSLHTGFLTSGQYEIPVKFLNNGSYIVSLTVGGKRYTNQLNVVK